jgi:hypothetical protein
MRTLRSQGVHGPTSAQIRTGGDARAYIYEIR